MAARTLTRVAFASAMFLFFFAGVPVSLDNTAMVESELAPEQTLIFDLNLESGEFVRLSVEPLLPYVMTSLRSPDGSQVVMRFRSHQNKHAETMSYIADKPGTYQLAAGSKSPRPGKCVIRVLERRPSKPGDRDRIEAEQAFVKARMAEMSPTPEAMRESLGTFERALVLFRKIGDQGAIADTLNQIGEAEMYYLGEHRRSLPRFLEALAIRECLPDEMARAHSLEDAGEVYRTLGDARRALAYYRAALGAKDPEMPREIAITMRNIAMALDDTGDMAALPYYEAILDLIREAGEPIGEGYMHHSIGMTLNNRGEWREALVHAREALRIWREVQHDRGIGHALVLLGLIYSNLGEYERALHYYGKALEARQDRADPREKAELFSLIGSSEREMGNAAGASEHLQKALDIYRKVADPVMEAEALLELGKARERAGDLAAALQNYNQALSISRTVDYVTLEATSLAAVAGVESLGGRYGEAREAASKAIALRRATGVKGGEASALLTRARIEQASGNLQAARTDAEAALAIAEALRSNIGTPESRAAFLASVSEMYEFLIDVFMRLHQQQPGKGFDLLALRTSEQARARSLMDLLAQSRAAAKENSPKLAHLRSLRERMSAKAQAQLKLAPGKSAQAKLIALDLEELNAQYEQVLVEIGREDPALAAIARPEPFDLAQLQREVLDSSSALLEYSLGADRSFVWVVTQKGLSSYELPPRVEIEAVARQAYARISKPDGSMEDLATVSRLILAPISKHLRGGRIIVVADGALQYLPFGALPLPGSTGPLIADHEVVVLPSASTIRVFRRSQRKRAATRLLAVFADPVFERADPRLQSGAAVATTAAARAADDELVESEVDRSSRESGLTGLPRLPFTRREAVSVLSLVPPSQRKEALDFEANRGAVMDPDLGRYRFVHFATHGLLNTLHPELSGIVLSMVDARGREQNGFLSTADVFNLSLAADLVVLSGCRTGLGKEIRGEGITGLTRAFMYAGAPRVVASLWNVSDAATADLMKRFYEGMLGAKRLSPAAALRSAQLEIQAQPRWRAPYYWAAFVMQGEWK